MDGSKHGWIGQGVIRTLKSGMPGGLYRSSPHLQPLYVVLMYVSWNSYSPFETCRTLVDLRAGDAHKTPRNWDSNVTRVASTGEGDRLNGVSVTAVACFTWSERCESQ